MYSLELEILFRLKTPTDLSNTWKLLTKMVLCTCRWTVQSRHSESNVLHTVKLTCVCSAVLLQPETPLILGLLHTHTLAAHVLSALLNRYVLRNSERNHQHLLSPQSWIWVFSCSVSQENRADLPSSSSYFRSLTKCCKNRHVNSDLHSEQKTVGMVKEPINT